MPLVSVTNICGFGKL